VKRKATDYIESNFGLSERRACRVIGIHRSTMQYEQHRQDDGEIRESLKELAKKYRKYGCIRLHIKLKREGYKVNHKKIERIYREEKLQIYNRKKKKRAAVQRVKLASATRRNERWSMDFIHDSLSTGRRFKNFTLVDDFTKVCPVIYTDTSITGKKVVEELDKLKETIGLPKEITVDNGPEFISNALDEWAYKNNVMLYFIEPGRPTENPFIESFNGKFRDECLSMHWFLSIPHARELIEQWRIEYNTERPHSSLKYMTPSEFVAQLNEKTIAGSLQNTNLQLAHITG